MGKLLTAQELAEILNLSVETVWRYTRQKKIPVLQRKRTIIPTYTARWA